jgi:flagellar hook-associated protein 3 FlgL
MRVSTSQIFYSGTSSILNGQSDLYKTQNQLSTGRRILTPRDDPVDSTLALMATQSKEVNESFLKSQGTASDHLAFLDTQLGAVSDLLQDVVSRAVQGGNDTYSAQQKQAIAEELKRRFEGLVDLANTRNAAGEYVFSGNRTNVEPFSVSGSGGNYSLAGPTRVSYNGDDGQRRLQVEVSQTVATTESGQEVFMRVVDADGSLNGRSVFDAVQNMIDTLDSSSGVSPAPSYDQALDDLHDALDHVSRIRASVGARMNQMDALTEAGSDLAVQYENKLSKLQDLDYAEAISRLNQQQMQLQASQASFVKTSQLSLFDLIS